MDELPPIPAGPSILAQQQSPIHRDAMAALPSFALQPSEFDHAAAKQRLRQYKKEQDQRRRREFLRQQKAADELRAAMAAEQEKMAARAAEREDAIRQRALEKQARMAEERRQRAADREAAKQRERKEMARRREKKPLYERMEEQARDRMAKEEAARAAAAREQRGDVTRVVDFDRMRREREVQLAEQKRALEAKRAEARRELLEGALPPAPSRQYYSGRARSRVVEEDRNARNQQKIKRDEAAQRRKRASMCAQLHANSFAQLREAGAAKPRGASAAALSPPRRAGGPRLDPASSLSPSPNKRGGGGAAPRGFEGARDRATARPHGVYQLSSTSRALSERVKALDREVKEMETQLSARARSEGTVDEWEALLDAREALSKRYVGAIKANLELLESIGNDRDAAASV